MTDGMTTGRGHAPLPGRADDVRRPRDRLWANVVLAAVRRRLLRFRDAMIRGDDVDIWRKQPFGGVRNACFRQM